MLSSQKYYCHPRRATFLGVVGSLFTKFMKAIAPSKNDSYVRCLLSAAPAKRRVRIVGLLGEREARSRLSDLGLVETARVTVSSSSRIGIVLTLSSGGRLAIDRKLADDVMVESL